MRYVYRYALALGLCLPGCLGGVAYSQQCQCFQGGFCPCGSACACEPAGKWHPADDGSGDYGFWRGDTLVWRYVAKTGLYHRWDGSKYAAGVPLTQPVRVFQPFQRMFGSCPNCR